MTQSKSAYISIGRNIAGIPMTDAEWAGFKTRIGIIARDTGLVVSDAEGAGQYDGRIEETYILVVQLWPNTNLIHLRRDLANAAVTYKQESIALAIAEVEFIEAGNIV